jgi:hypothetical protein
MIILGKIEHVNKKENRDPSRVLPSLPLPSLPMIFMAKWPSGPSGVF